jgi:phosphoglycolate phosphatase
MSTLRHVIFDLDGTLADSLPGIAWSIDEALAACGLPPSSTELRPLIGPPIRSILATISGLEDGLALDRLEKAFRTSYDADGWRRTLCYAGVTELLRELQAEGVGLWIVTNKPARATGNILRELALESYFEEVVSRDSRSPAYGSKAEAAGDLIERRGLDRLECVFIGDTEEDLRAAAEIGVRCVIVSHGYGSGLHCGPADWTSVRACFAMPFMPEAAKFHEVGSYDRP